MQRAWRSEGVAAAAVALLFLLLAVAAVDALSESIDHVFLSAFCLTHMQYRNAAVHKITKITSNGNEGLDLPFTSDITSALLGK